MCSVHQQPCSGPDTGQGVGDPHDGGYAIFTGDDCGVGQHSACFRDHRSGHPEQRCPCGVGRVAYQDVARPDGGKLVHAADGPCRPGGDTGAGADSGENRVRRIDTFRCVRAGRGGVHLSPPDLCRACRTAGRAAAGRPGRSEGRGLRRSGARSVLPRVQGTKARFPRHPSPPGRRKAG